MVGGESLDNFLKTNMDEMGWDSAILSYVFEHLSKRRLLEVLTQMLEERHKQGFEEGQEDVRDYFRQGLKL